MSIGLKIKELRIKNKLSQSELAEKLSVTDRAISKWETEKGDPSIDLLKNIAKLFHVSIDYLITDEKPTEVKKTKKSKLSEKQKQKILSNVLKEGILDIDKLMMIVDKDFAIECIKKYPIDEVEKLWQLYKGRNYAEMFKIMVNDCPADDLVSLLNIKSVASKFKMIKYIIHKINNSPIGFEKISSYSWNSREIEKNKEIIQKLEKKVEESLLKVDEIREQLTNKCKQQIKLVDALEKDIQYKKVLKNLDAGKINDVVLDACRLLELKLNVLGYEGELHEKLRSFCANYFNDHKYYDDEDEEHETVSDMSKLLYRLRKMRNAYVHGSENDAEPLSVMELEECVKFIFNLKAA